MYLMSVVAKVCILYVTVNFMVGCKVLPCGLLFYVLMLTVSFKAECILSASYELYVNIGSN